MCLLLPTLHTVLPAALALPAPRGKTAPVLASPAGASSIAPESVFSFGKQTLHQFCIGLCCSHSGVVLFVTPVEMHTHVLSSPLSPSVRWREEAETARCVSIAVWTSGFLVSVLITHLRICRVPADHAVFFRSFSSAVQVVLRRRVLHRCVGTLPLSCRGWHDISLLARAFHVSY